MENFLGSLNFSWEMMSYVYNSELRLYRSLCQDAVSAEWRCQTESAEVYWGYRDNGNYYSILGLYRINGKENVNYYIELCSLLSLLKFDCEDCKALNRRGFICLLAA